MKWGRWKTGESRESGNGGGAAQDGSGSPGDVYREAAGF